jgi:hypothetical protein
MTHVLTSVRSLHSAVPISPGTGRALRTATASCAEEATWVCTPHSLRAMATASGAPGPLTNCLLSRHVKICGQVRESVTIHFYRTRPTIRRPTVRP